MKNFIVISVLVYSLSLSLPQSGPGHMSLYESTEIENRINSDFKTQAVQMELMSFYTDPDSYKMVPSYSPVIGNYSQKKPDNSNLEVFGVRIPADNLK